jgi:hypothetical protein
MSVHIWCNNYSTVTLCSVVMYKLKIRIKLFSIKYVFHLSKQLFVE